MMKRYVIMGGTLLAMIAATVVATMSYAPTNTVISTASWEVGYDSIKSLTNGADVIVMGTIVTEKSYKYYFGDNDFDMFTNYTFAILQVYKGNVTDNIVIKQTGGKTENTLYEIVDDPLLSQEVPMILFLKQFGPDSYYIIGGPQGRFHIIDEKVYSVGEIYSSAAGTTSLLRQSGISVNDFVKQINP